ncbi:MAG: sugar phosphate isomerase/epimerase [Verrucomicrobia bacterium]|nr:sugar phosphate isomerase/epimerase [Verrucomicrobiota bacterium]MBU4290615.1 sugar phosphate isomerase/epimerase [Verrucomicrobiota bacterium]MBU4429224.1 sugar phosphate isomerase/epimerase [Verrucomicrobiota bacterium]MBU4498448.1 sugar phosphate isomerase/epimerase [Verrucomicrobiota bacterium]
MMSYTLARQPGFSLKTMLDLTQELGLTGIDFVSLHGADPRELKTMAQDIGVAVVCYTFGADVNYASTQARAAGIDQIKQGIETAVLLGAPRIMCCAGGKPEYTCEESRRHYLDAFAEIMDFARKAGVMFSVENMHGKTSPFVTSADMLEAVRAVPGLKITFDNGNCMTGGEEPAASFTRSADYVIHAHFKDWSLCAPGEQAGMPGKDGRHYKPALIGEGIVPHRACLAAMKQAGYKGYINIEYEGNKYPPDDATRRAAGYLYDLIQE